jgi:hypothetical protein
MSDNTSLLLCYKILYNWVIVFCKIFYAKNIFLLIILSIVELLLPLKPHGMTSLLAGQRACEFVAKSGQ